MSETIGQTPESAMTYGITPKDAQTFTVTDRYDLALARIEEDLFSARDYLAKGGHSFFAGLIVPYLESLKDVLELHTARAFYDLCNHDDHADGIEVNETDEGYTCEPLKYYVCTNCCGEYETDLCDNEHKHGKDEPTCPTAELIIEGVL